jgi:hypothetical protein
MLRLMGDRSAIDQHDNLLLEEGHGCLPPRVKLGLLALVKSPRGHVVFHHGALFELVPDGGMHGLDRSPREVS